MQYFIIKKRTCIAYYMKLKSNGKNNFEEEKQAEPQGEVLAKGTCR